MLFIELLTFFLTINFYVKIVKNLVNFDPKCPSPFAVGPVIRLLEQHREKVLKRETFASVNGAINAYFDFYNTTGVEWLF